MGTPTFKANKDNYTGGAAVTPSDSTAVQFSALYIGGTGTGALKVDTSSGDTLTFAGLTVGTILPVAVIKVYSTGTGVTSIVGLK